LFSAIFFFNYTVLSKSFHA